MNGASHIRLVDRGRGRRRLGRRVASVSAFPAGPHAWRWDWGATHRAVGRSRRTGPDPRARGADRGRRGVAGARRLPGIEGVDRVTRQPARGQQRGDQRGARMVRLAAEVGVRPPAQAVRRVGAQPAQGRSVGGRDGGLVRVSPAAVRRARAGDRLARARARVGLPEPRRRRGARARAQRGCVAALRSRGGGGGSRSVAVSVPARLSAWVFVARPRRGARPRRCCVAQRRPGRGCVRRAA